MPVLFLLWIHLSPLLSVTWEEDKFWRHRSQTGTPMGRPQAMSERNGEGWGLRQPGEHVCISFLLLSWQIATKFGDLKQQKFTILQFWRLEAQPGCHWTQLIAGKPVSHLEALWETPFPSLFQFLGAVLVPWPTISHHIASSSSALASHLFLFLSFHPISLQNLADSSSPLG